MNEVDRFENIRRAHERAVIQTENLQKEEATLKDSILTSLKEIGFKNRKELAEAISKLESDLEAKLVEAEGLLNGSGAKDVGQSF